MYFLPTLIIVVISLIYMAMGFVAGKFKKMKSEHLKSFSSLLVYICGPGMVVNSFLNVEFNTETGLKMLYFFLTTLFLQLLFCVLMYFILHKHIENNKVRLTCVTAVCGNVGFFGLPLIQALFPNEPIVMAYSSLFVMSMNVVAFTFGAFCLTNDKKYISLKKAFINPTAIAIYAVLPFFFFGVTADKLGDFSVIFTILSKMTTPICMIMLGIRLSNANLKDLFTRPFVYISCVLKLIIFPLFCYLCVVFLPFFDDVFKSSIFVLCACPSAAIVASLAELYQVEEENAANVVLFATIICVITLPLLMLIL